MERRAPHHPFGHRFGHPFGRFHLGLAALVVLGVLAGPPPAAAQTCTAVITVRTVADAAGTCPGASCSLRTAIAQANADPDCTRIEFDFTPAFGGYIALVSPLPTITSPVEIDGWSHPNSTRFPENGVGPSPVFRVGIRGDTNNIAGAGLRFLDAGYGLVQGISVNGFSTGAGIEVAASTNADQNVTITENILGRLWQTDLYPPNRVGVSVQARGVHIGGGRTTDPGGPQGPIYFLDNSRGNYFRGSTGPAIHVTTSPFGIQGRARIIGNHFDDYDTATPLLVDLGPEGPTPNDPGDPDAGPNDLQNKPEILLEPMRFPPLEGDPPGPPCTAANNYQDCNGVRVTVRLAGAPAGSYTAELLAGNMDPLLGDNGQIKRFLLTGAITRTGSGDLDFEFEMGAGIELIGAVLAWFQSGGVFALPPVRALVSQGGIDAFDGATSEIAQAGDVSVPAPTFTRYFAEGVGGSFFDTIFSLSNFGSAAATATMTFHTDAGQVVTHTVPVPAGGRPVTIDVDTVPGLNGAAFGTTITADQLLVASRTMRWDATGYGTHADNGVPAARTRWFLAEGVTGAFDTYVLVYNPSDTAAQLTMSFNRIAPNPPVVRTYTLAPHRRLTVAVDGVDPVLEATDVAIDVTSTNGVGVVVERSVYLSSPTTIYEAGTGSSAGEVGTQWYFGEGVASATFDTFLLFYNPNAVTAEVQVRYMRRFGAPVTATYTIAAGNRLSVWTDLIAGLDQQEFGMVVTSMNDVPVAVERAVWGGGAPFIDGHASQGLSTPSLRWGLNGGEADNAAGADTYVLIVNPTIDNASARITLVFEDGTSSTPLTVSVPAQRRANVSVANQIPASNGRRFSILVESIGGEPVPIVVERSTYTSPGSLWRAGSNEVGTPLP